MPKLRLFANLREIAGTSRVEIAADTVGRVIEIAGEQYGPEFKRGVETSRVWVNGKTALMDDPVLAEDEVVLIPPVSGGSQPQATLSATDLVGFAPIAVGVLAVLANLQGQAIWTAAVVAIAAVWAMDLGSVFSLRHKEFAPLAVAVTAVGGVMSAHVLGYAGYGLAVAVAVLVALGWAVVIPRYREVSVYAPVLIVSLMAGLAGASLTLVRSAHSPDTAAADVFLVAVLFGVILGSVAERLPAMPLMDPFSVTAIGAIIGGVAAAALWDLDVVSYLLAGLGIAVALVAGRGFASMLRTGRVALTERPPGILASVDGVVLAAAIYFPLLLIIL